MLHYKTINEAKQHLPEIIDRINDCKIFFDCATMLLRDMQRWCVQEAVDPTKDYGWWTSLKAYAETVKNQMAYLSEMEYLQGVVDKIQQHPSI